MKLLTLLATFTFLFGCSTQSSKPINSVSSVNSLSSPNKTKTSNSIKAKQAIIADCKPVTYEITSSGEFLDSGYICPANNPITAYKINGCSWVKSYIKKNGTRVSAHKRCKFNFKTDIGKTYNYSGSKSSSGGPVRVRGYYRKNGTYVRPHTRSRPRYRSRTRRY